MGRLASWSGGGAGEARQELRGSARRSRNRRTTIRGRMPPARASSLHSALAAQPALVRRSSPCLPLLVQPDLLIKDLPLGVVDVVLHPRLSDLIERRAGDRVPVELVGHELLKFLGNGLALPRIHFPGVAKVVVVDFGVDVARGVPRRGAVR